MSRNTTGGDLVTLIRYEKSYIFACIILLLVFQRLEASESENNRLQEREAKTQSELERLKGQHHATIITEV